MKHNISLLIVERIFKTIAIVLLLTSCTVTVNKEDKNALHLEGTWELISGTTIVKNDTTFTDYTKDQRMIKIINATHFAFVRHDLNKGKDSTAGFDAGAGHYTLSGDKYTEYLEYCSNRAWEGQVFHFTMQLSNDTLTQTGHEQVEAAGVDRMIIERYKKTNQEDK